MHPCTRELHAVYFSTLTSFTAGLLLQYRSENSALIYRPYRAHGLVLESLKSKYFFFLYYIQPLWGHPASILFPGYSGREVQLTKNQHLMPRLRFFFQVHGSVHQR
jgi:hypothetical protein